MAQMNLFIICFALILEVISSSPVAPSHGGEKVWPALDKDIVPIRKRILMEIVEDKSNLADHFVEDQTIKVLAIVDYSTYSFFLELANNVPKMAMADLRLFFAHVFHKMDKAYQSIDTNEYRYVIKMVDMIVLQTPEESELTESKDVADVSEDEEHLRTVSNELVLPLLEDLISGRDFDAALAFTMYPSSDGSAGVAYHDTSCTPSAVGLVHLKNIDFTAKVAAHELGHILGANHDGEENSCHGDEQDTVMTWKGESSMAFSECSADYFARRVSHLKKIGKNCLEKKTSKHLEFKMELQQMPGKRFGTDDQCVFSHGKGFRHEEVKDLSEICKYLWCHTEDATDVLTMGGTLDGTKCGRRQRCMDRKCVRSNA